MLAILLLPRQWQVAVVENVDERHVKKAMWLFPLYLLLINVFVFPIAIAGLLTFADAGTPTRSSSPCHWRPSSAPWPCWSSSAACLRRRAW